VYRIYFARCMNIFHSLLAQLVKYDVHTTRKINSIHAIFYHILSLYFTWLSVCTRTHTPSHTHHLLKVWNKKTNMGNIHS